MDKIPCCQHRRAFLCHYGHVWRSLGKVLGRRDDGSRRIEFGDLMNGIVAASTDRMLHVILDNLSMRKPRRDQWLARDRNVNFCQSQHGVDLAIEPLERISAVYPGAMLSGEPV